MPKRIRKPPSKKGGKFGNYLKKGLELGALGAVQFVPGLDVAADAAVAGEAAEGAEAGEAALTAGEAVGKKVGKRVAKKGESRLSKYVKGQATQYVQGKIDDATQEAENYAQQKVSSYLNPQPGQPPSQAQYRTPYPTQMPYSPRYREPMMPPQVGAGYREPYYPPPKKPLLGPLEKKIIMYGVIFLIIGIIVLVIIRTLAHSIDGYYHSSTGCHCKKNNHCGSGKKHNCNGGSNTKNSGHNSCGGS
jgi:hypothetical protein